MRALAVARFALLVMTLRAMEIIHANGQITGMAVVAVYVACLLTEIQISRRWLPVHRVRYFRGANAVIVALGGVVALAVCLAAVALWDEGMTMSSIAVARPIPDWQTHRFGIGTQLLALALLAFGALIPLTLARRIAMSRLRNKPVPDERAPILLRSFTDDRIRLRSRRVDRAGLLDRVAMRKHDRFEEILAGIASKYGPIVAGATPGERLAPPLGAVRHKLPATDWQNTVRLMAHQAQFVVMVVGRSEGTVWEMRQLVDEGLLSKTVIVIPPVGRAERLRRAALVANVFGVPWEALDTSDTGRSLLAVVIPLLSPAIAYVADAADDLSYDVALSSAFEALRDSDPAHAVQHPRAELDADARPAAETVSSIPPVEVIPAGHYRPQRRWSRRVWLVGLSLSLIVTPALGLVFDGYVTRGSEPSQSLQVRNAPGIVARRLAEFGDHGPWRRCVGHRLHV